MEVMIALAFFWANNNASLHQHLLPRHAPRKSRLFYPRLTLEQFTDEEVHRFFRLNKAAIQELYNKISHFLEPRTSRSHAIPGMTKLLAALHYFATGSFQYCAGGKLGLSQASFSRILRQVIPAIRNVSSQYIKFPSTEHEFAQLREQFYTVSGIPRIIGLIDCTHVPLIPPKEVEQAYRNRKMFHSMNIQVICGPNMEILDFVAKFPGSCHDAFILANSHVGAKFASGFFGDHMLLGDNGYRLCPWLLTPYIFPATPAEQRYNRAHRKTRGLVERMFGVWKSRFRCLDITGGALLYEPEMVGQIVFCCAVLHNIAIRHNIPVNIRDDLREHISHQGEIEPDRNQDGHHVRAELTQNLFS